MNSHTSSTSSGIFINRKRMNDHERDVKHIAASHVRLALWSKGQLHSDPGRSLKRPQIVTDVGGLLRRERHLTNRPFIPVRPSKQASTIPKSNSSTETSRLSYIDLIKAVTTQLEQKTTELIRIKAENALLKADLDGSVNIKQELEETQKANQKLQEKIAEYEVRLKMLELSL
ncbi:hypothetical protein VNI00_010214 [Paramarasmius palmivorus]|uniref:Uncharacterized protein n=1 Tax=Paramarasmius palmivorus TaxID=297713 RepID=A0AAW0BXX7_9AGAR